MKAFLKLTQTLTGWRRRGFIALLGALAALAMPPFYLFPLLVPSLTGLFLCVYDATTRRQAFWAGWFWAWGFFVVGIYWICISFFVEPEKFAWLTPFALLGLPGFLAIYTGLATLLTFQLRLNGLYKIIAFALLWTGCEALRATIFTGFPWNMLGYAWTVSDVSIQLASLGGVYGLTFLTVLLASMPALWVLRVPHAKIVNYAACATLVIALGFGVWRLEQHPTQFTATSVRIVQANIPQSLKWNPAAVLDGLKKHIALTHKDSAQPQLVIWPETAIPYDMSASLAREVGLALPAGSTLISGGLRSNNNPKHWQGWNSVFAISSAGKIIAQYDKHHLVPFGEFIPLRGILPVENISGGIGDFSRGPGAQTLSIPPYPSFSPLICYEAIFTSEAADRATHPQWLLNVTNDAWFGFSTGPYQHLQMARMRAVEQGLPLIRAANTGISAAFDGLGREIARLPLENTGILDLYLPREEVNMTIFSRYTYSSFLFIIAVTGAFGLILALFQRITR